MSVNEAIDTTLSSWMKKEGPEGDIVLGTRIRLARNLREIPFPAIAPKESLKNVLELTSSLTDMLKVFGNFSFYKMAEVEELDRKLLVEKHLISPKHTENPKFKGLLLRDHEDISIMINEEDHLRLQVLFPGLQLEPAWNLISEIDDTFEKKLDYAFDEERGYLTACPTNVGTGMRTSVMVHLPALAKLKQINKVLGSISQFGLVVRGIYGEGSEVYGNIYQISNQITLGHKEEDVVEHLSRVTSQIINSERQARNYLIEPKRKLFSEDEIYRSYGMLSNARIMSTQEAMELLSQVRLGIDLGLIKNLDNKILKELMVLIRGAHLQKLMGQNLPAEERDKLRASLIRDRLKVEKK